MLATPGLLEHATLSREDIDDILGSDKDESEPLSGEDGKYIIDPIDFGRRWKYTGRAGKVKKQQP
jgi:hypothetical protein